MVRVTGLLVGAVMASHVHQSEAAGDKLFVGTIGKGMLGGAANIFAQCAIKWVMNPANKPQIDASIQKCETKLGSISQSTRDSVWANFQPFGRRLEAQDLNIDTAMTNSNRATCGDLKSAYNENKCCRSGSTPDKFTDWRRLTCNKDSDFQQQRTTQAADRDSDTGQSVLVEHLLDSQMKDDFESWYTSVESRTELDTLKEDMDKFIAGLGNSDFIKAKIDALGGGDYPNIARPRAGNMFATCADLKTAYDDADCCADNLEQVTYWHRFDCNGPAEPGGLNLGLMDPAFTIDDVPTTMQEYTDFDSGDDTPDSYVVLELQ